jgi:NADPH2:quinone reductase
MRVRVAPQPKKNRVLAIRLSHPGGPDALEVVDLPPPALVAGALRVQAIAFGIGRPDVMIRTGKYKWMPPLPAVIGNEMVGTVVETAPDVDPAWLGRQVLVSARELAARGGCHAQQVVIPAATAIALPEAVDAAAATALPNYQLAWGLLHDATRGRLPRRIYLNGAAGGVGSAMLQLCSQLGIEAVAGAGTAAKRAFASEQGAAATIDTGLAPADIAQAVMDATDGHGVDAVYDHLCGPGITAHLGALAPFGLLVSYNALGGPPPDDLFAALRAQAARAPAVAAYNMHAYNSRAADRRALLETPLRWLAKGRLRPAIGRLFAMNEVRQAHEALDARDFTGKLVLLA